MEQIWAPWRSAYIKNKQQKGCLFCRIARSRQDKKNYVLSRSNFYFSVLNIHPYNNGHVMIAPYRHLRDLEDLSSDEILDLFNHFKKIRLKLDKCLKPQAYNVGLNIGKIAGAGIDKHIHIHIVPRWLGDTNFMPVINMVKVIPQSLDELYKKLKHAH
ncbi:MAG: HIT domain-containing protein [Candidatus Omnitrophota bacterium]